MKKFVSSAAVCVFLTNPASSGFAEFCKPKITKEIIDEAIDQGIFQNKEDGFDLDLVTLDYFVNNQHYKKLYDPLISKLIKDQAIENEKRLDAKELKEAAFENLKNVYKGPFKAIRDWWYSEETPITVPVFVAHDEEYLRKKVEELDTGNELSEQTKKAIVKDLVDKQPEFIKKKEEIARNAYGEVGVGKKLLYTGGVGAVGTAASSGFGYTVKKISEKAAKKIIEKGTEALLTNSAGYVIGAFTVVGLVLSVGGGAYQLYSEYNYATKRLLEENYARRSIDIAFARDNVKIAKKKLKDAIKDGLWIGKNAFYSVVSNDPNCKLTPISMFRKIKGLPEPDTNTRKMLAKKTCKELGCEKELDKCKDYLVFKVDACIYKNPHANCPDIPQAGCKKLENWEDIFAGDL